ncbi:uncharacterized protein PRCAT00005061001 [Priceomyces carsonii]|uniref:uncharacterized protein n=1 Tax=Priceomyces carsonii TaxID=28549 RepID=UPI002EDA51DC|nr:unnamed protein product [Priceomyces carsonii]
MERPICLICSKEFSRKDHLRRHQIITHSEQRSSIVCEYCNKVFTRNDTLRRHMTTCSVALEINSGNPLALSNRPKGRKKRSCERCNFTKRKCSFSSDTNGCTNCIKSGILCSRLKKNETGFSEGKLLVSTDPTDPISKAYSSSSAPLFFLLWCNLTGNAIFSTSFPLGSPIFNKHDFDVCPTDIFGSPSPTNLLSETEFTSPILLTVHNLTETLSPKIKTWLDGNNVQKFISLYFNHFHLHTPFLHKSTFVIFETPSSLLYCLLIIGALYSDVDMDVKFALSQLDTVEGYINVNEPKTDSRDYPLHVIQAYVCLYTALTWSGSKRQRQHAIENFPRLVTLVKNKKLNHACHKVSYSKSEEDWKDWIQSEMKIRTCYSVFLLDTSHLIFFNNFPRIVPSELRLPLPSHHNWWEASSYEEWHATYFPRPLFLEVAQFLINADSVDLSYNLYMYDFFVLLHALYVNMWFQKQLLNFFTSSQIKAQRKALENWKTIWNRAIERIPENEWSKFGFCRNAIEYYWLARLFLSSKEKRLLLEYDSPGAIENLIKDAPSEKLDSDEELLSFVILMKAVRSNAKINNVDDVEEILEDSFDILEKPSEGQHDIFKFILWKNE